MPGPAIRALLHTAPSTLELGEVELPAPGDADVVVRVEACGVCATNLHGWARAPGGPSGRPGAHGHEIAGVVESVGPSVSGVARGDRVAVDPAVACGCGRCEACAGGDPMRCRDQAMLPVWGFADALVVPARSLVHLPDALPSDVASLAEPLASAVHGLRHSHHAARDGRIDGARVLVLGAGAVGLLSVAAARHLGASEVTVLARHDHQAAAADSLGADRVVRDGARGALEAIRGTRPHLVVEAAGGRATTLELAMACVDRGGEVVVLGLFDGPRTIDVNVAVMRNLRVFFSAAYAARDGRTDVEVAVELLAAEPALAGLVTRTVPLADAPGLAIASRDHVRVVVRP